MNTNHSERTNPDSGDALLIVDLQNDFLPGGALGVPEADGLVETINGHVAAFQAEGLPVVATRDWHPPGHCSFQAQGGPWPAHCVAGSEGAAFPPELALPESALIVDKATEVEPDAYSGFQGTGLTDWLRERGVRRVFVVGLATDYCVRATAMDAIAAGFDVVLLEDGMRAVNLEPDDGARAIAEMHAKGARSARIDAGTESP